MNENQSKALELMKAALLKPSLLTHAGLVKVEPKPADKAEEKAKEEPKKT